MNLPFKVFLHIQYICAEDIMKLLNHFIFKRTYKIHCNNLNFTFSLFRASGHVERFADFMTKDMKTGECFRVDHLIEGSVWLHIFEKGC